MSPRTCSQWAQAPIRVQRLYWGVCDSSRITRLQTRSARLNSLPFAALAMLHKIRSAVC